MIHGVRRCGFTILEIVIFSAIFAIAGVLFVGILTVVTRIQARQGAAAEVHGQSQFLLQLIQDRIERSALVELAADTPTSTLKLRTASSTDPMLIYLSGATVYLRETLGGAPQPLTTSRVQVTNLTFTKRENPGGKDAVAVSFTVAYNTSNLQQRFIQTLGTTVARVTAATFDSDIRASTTNTYKIGAVAQEWQSINSTIYFSGSDVGVAVSSPLSRLHVSGGDIRVSSGDLYVETAGSARGLILKRPDLSGCYRISINNSGNFVTSSIACP